MTHTELLSYVGAITGVAGAVMGYISYRRSAKMKALDLRIELMKMVADQFHELQAIDDLLVRAEKSRVAVAAATGRLQSGAHEQWIKQLAADHESIEVFDQEFHDLNSDHFKATSAELEGKIIQAHSLKTSLIKMKEKYVGELASDEIERNNIREDVRAKGLRQL